MFSSWRSLSSISDWCLGKLTELSPEVSTISKYPSCFSSWSKNGFWCCFVEFSHDSWSFKNLLQFWLLNISFFCHAQIFRMRDPTVCLAWFFYPIPKPHPPFFADLERGISLANVLDRGRKRDRVYGFFCPLMRRPAGRAIGGKGEKF